MVQHLVSLEHAYLRMTMIALRCKYHGRNNLRIFLGGGKIRGVGIFVLLLRNEGNFWYKAPCCCFLVDSC